jgi:hypothetical protein
MGNLDDFLKDDELPVAEEAPETPEAVETPIADEPEEKAPVRDERGRFASKAEPEAPPAEEPPLDHAALLGERRRRQEAEQRLAEIEQRIAQPPQPAPDIFEDTQGWQQHLSQDIVQQSVQQATFNARLDMSEMMVRQSHPDFEDKKAVFLDLMNETPGLRERALQDPHPWNFAYQYVGNHQRMAELSAVNVAELEAKLRERITAELKAAPPPQVPDTLAAAQSSRGSSAAYSPPTLDQILQR